MPFVESGPQHLDGHLIARGLAALTGLDPDQAAALVMAIGSGLMYGPRPSEPRARCYRRLAVGSAGADRSLLWHNGVEPDGLSPWCALWS